jgi:riboflavin transporter FmnP
MKKKIHNIALSGMFLALCLVLPFLTGQLQQLGSALSPMHIPVLLCGFVCGWQYGLAVGFIAPLLRFALFGMPPIFPVGVSMAFELAVYGVVSGLLYRALPKKVTYIYISLAASMLAGRVIWGAVRFIIAGLNNTEFSFMMFLDGAFLTAVPGIILHLVLVPLIIITLQKAKLIGNERAEIHTGNACC